MFTLVGQSGPLAGSRFELDGDVVLGRENAAISLDDEETSRRHAEIRVADGVAVIEDLDSTNGTFVDGRRIDGPVTLTGGEEIRLGQSTFAIEASPAPAPVVDRGATRLSARPEALDDSDRTQLRDRPAAPAQGEDSELTSRRPRPAAVPPAAQPPAAPPPDRHRTSPGERPASPARAADPRAAPKPPLAAPGGQAPAAQPFGTFAPSSSSRRRGVASRKLGPTIVSFATILTTAAALVVYFAGR